MNFSPNRNFVTRANGVKSNAGFFMRVMNYCRKIICLLAFGLALNAIANPTGMTVQSGSATTAVNGSQLTITTSQNAFLNWQSFNIGSGETTIFNQPSASSIAFNRINDPNPSQIFGNLQANGVVVLLNSSGFYFGPNSFVSAAGLVVSTANCIPPQNSGGSWQFNGPPPLASIINYGKINVGQNGSAFLIANNIENHGEISAPGGSIGLAAGQTVLLSDRPDGRGMSMAVTLPGGSVDNSGKLIADGGTIALNAKVVNQDGFIQANSVQNQNGVIELVASDQINLGANSQISANGDDSIGGSSGGTVTIQSGNNFSDDIGSQISVIGGSQGGNGGSVEISASSIEQIHSQLNGSAQSGSTGGKMLLDPQDLILDSSSLDVYSGFSSILFQATRDITLADGTAWSLSDSTGLNSGSLTLLAGRNIVFGDGAQIFDANNWSVTLKAGVNNFNTGAVTPGVGSIYVGGFDGTSPEDLSGSIQMASGSINLTAGQNILVGSGYVITTGGGNISAHALSGNIDTGSDAQGYHFNSNVHSWTAAYTLQNGLGGISTAAGGNVSLIAGGDVTSVLPGRGSYIYDGSSVSPDNGNDYLTGGSGAYGSQAGNVTIIAGGNVIGNYLVANGIGSIYAGVQMDANGNPIVNGSGNYVLGNSGSAGTDLLNPNLALNLISGGWNVTAAQNIILQEVRNPNGVFDISGGSAFNHYFNYAPSDFVNLSAGNLVQLGASSSLLPRLSGGNNNVPTIYPSILNIEAGAGGVTLGTPGSPNSLILFPSPLGSLTIETFNGGSLIGNLNTVQGAPQLFNLIVSDAGHNQYTSTANFGVNDNAASPVHLNSSTPIDLNISGNMDLVFLDSPESAQINVGGDMVNCGFQGMNLSAASAFQVPVQEANGDIFNATVNPGVTSINVAGDIYNRSAFTAVNLNQVIGSQAPDLSLLAQAINNNISAATLLSSIYYDAASGVLTYQNISGVSLSSVLQLLQHLTIQVYKNGVPQWVDPEQTIPLTATVSILNAADAQALLAQYNTLGAIPTTGNGFVIGGGGQFNISARSIDLGTSAGIQSLGVGLFTVNGNYALASLFSGGTFDSGADISVTTTGNHSDGLTAYGDLAGDLDLFSSSIASVNGGDISLDVGGDVNAGSSALTVTTSGARGIYSSDRGNVTVVADGNIDVNGSRIAAYNGGDVIVESLNGNVNAGNGANGYVTVQQFSVDSTGKVLSQNPTIPGGGILATTFFDSLYPVGNILIETPNGNVNASGGGIMQLGLDGVPESSTLTVLAGYELRDFNGSAVLQNGLNIPSVLGAFIPGTENEPSQTVQADGKRFQVSLAVWQQLLGLLNLSQGANNVLDLLGSADPAALEATLTGTGPDLANYNFGVFTSGGRNIDASGSGVIGQNVILQASGQISGAAVSQHKLDVITPTITDFTGLGRDVRTDSEKSDPTVTLIGTDKVDSEGSDPGLILSADANGQGTTFSQGTAANAVSQSASNEDANKAVASSDDQADDKKKDKEITLAKKTGRVTVVLPPKNLSETKTPNHSL